MACIGLFTSPPAKAEGTTIIDGIDGYSIAVGIAQADTTILRGGIARNMKRRWFESGQWFVSGYWLGEISYWHSRSHQGGHKGLGELTMTPVFRLQTKQRDSGKFSPYFQAGIGLSLIGPTSIADRNFSTMVQFASQIGAGVRFGTRGHYQLGYRFEHISNGRIKSPNQGMDMHLIQLVIQH
ncbi:MAG: acyloxyacyl hydrolase [Pseudomonadales bacterium]|nr:acyloxyacyl hydrolase [Pseudomonadales bacterium]